MTSPASRTASRAGVTQVRTRHVRCAAHTHTPFQLGGAGHCAPARASVLRAGLCGLGIGRTLGWMCDVWFTRHFVGIFRNGFSTAALMYVSVRTSLVPVSCSDWRGSWALFLEASKVCPHLGSLVVSRCPGAVSVYVWVSLSGKAPWSTALTTSSDRCGRSLGLRRHVFLPRPSPLLLSSFLTVFFIMSFSLSWLDLLAPVSLMNFPVSHFSLGTWKFTLLW